MTLGSQCVWQCAVARRPACHQCVLTHHSACCACCLQSGADLARRLQEHGGSTSSQDGGASAAEAAATAATAAAANDVVRSMGQFVNNMSGLEGVVGGGDGDSSDSDSLASTDDDEDETGELKDVVLDMNKLMAVLAGTDIGTTGAAGGAGAAGEATAATAAASKDATLNSGEDAGSVHTHATTSGADAALTMGDIMVRGVRGACFPPLCALPLLAHPLMVLPGSAAESHGSSAGWHYPWQVL